MKRLAFVVLVVLFGTGRSMSDPAEAPKPEDRTLILDQRAYWRMWYTFSPAQISPEKLKSEGLKWLGETSLQRLRQRTEARHKQDGLTGDWMQDAVVPNESTGFPFDTLSIETRYRLRTAPPPADWMKADFNDSDWPREKRFFGMPARASLRTRFEVPDPATVKGMVLEVVYRGGIVVYLNGQEIGRGHLPAGELGPEVTGEEYPADAYIRKEGEYSELIIDTPLNQYCETKRDGKNVLAPELPKKWTNYQPCQNLEVWGKKLSLPESDKGKYRAVSGSNGVGAITREGFERIAKLRDRRLTIAISAQMLKKGSNVLALENRAARIHPLAMFWQAAYQTYFGWAHGGVQTLVLRADEHNVPSPLKRLPGMQVWVEDIHRRLYAADYIDSKVEANAARIVAGRNGVFGAQLVVGTDKELGAPKVTVGEFKRKDGAAAVFDAKVFYPVPHKIQEMQVGDNGRRLGNGFDFNIYARFVATHYGRPDVPYFDHLADQPPASIPANSSYPFWISVRVPAQAAPGVYRSLVTVQAVGMDPVQVPLEIEVFDWRIPDPKDFLTVMGVEESPYSLADRYKVALWSDGHFKLIGKSLAYLGEIDNSWLNIPVLMNTEFGNEADSPIKTTRRKDGSYAFDFTAMDRYLDLAIKYCGAPKVVNFIVMHPGNPGDGRMARSPMDVMVFDETTGKTEPYAVDRRAPDKERSVYYKAMANAIYEHMQTKGMDKSMYWGYTWDGPGTDPALYGRLAKFQPQVFWTKGSHQGGPTEYIKVPVTAYNSQLSAWFTSRKGWKRPELWLAYPRYWGTIIDCNDYSPPFCLRMLTERAISSGARGVSRVGADYWSDVYLRGHIGTYPVGLPNLFFLFPGENGPEASIRFAILKEGLQETEARIFLEQACEKLTAPEHKEFTERTTAMLNGRLVETLIDSPAMSNPELAELSSKGWQLRSRRLYQAAAETAGKLGLDADAVVLYPSIPARGKSQATLTLRNWTNQPRAWKLAGKEDWLVPEKVEGSLAEARQTVRIALDGTKLEPGKEAKGTLLLTDVASGRTDTIEVRAQVGAVQKVSAPGAVNLLPGRDSQTAVLFNTSGAEMSWTAATTIPGLEIEPAGGKLAAGSQVNIALKVKAGTEPGLQKGIFTVTEQGGMKFEQSLSLYVLTPYRTPMAPAGVATPLAELPKEAIKSFRESRGQKAPAFFKADAQKPKEKFTIGQEQKEFPAGFGVAVNSEAVYALEGKNFSAFAAEVGAAGGMSDSFALDAMYQCRFVFEIYADGKLVAQSGLMGLTDGPRLLVANNLARVKELKLAVRSEWGGDHRGIIVCWGNPAFYK